MSNGGERGGCWIADIQKFRACLLWVDGSQTHNGLWESNVLSPVSKTAQGLIIAIKSTYSGAGLLEISKHLCLASNKTVLSCYSWPPWLPLLLCNMASFLMWATSRQGNVLWGSLSISQFHLKTGLRRLGTAQASPLSLLLQWESVSVGQNVHMGWQATAPEWRVRQPMARGLRAWASQ